MSAKFDIAIPSTSPSERDIADQVERILRSETFQGSEILRNLLSYLSASAIERKTEPLKVKEIATAVFGRSEEFDSQSDSVVRVHTARLRSKLAEYYMSEGLEDEVVITIPKGSYALWGHFRAVPGAPQLAPHDVPHAEPAVDNGALLPVAMPGKAPRSISLRMLAAVTAAVICT